MHGFVVNKLKTPMVNATIGLKGSEKVYETSRPDARFKILLPKGKFTLVINCHDYQTKLVNIDVAENQISTINVTLEEETNTEESTVPVKSELKKPLKKMDDSFIGIQGKWLRNEFAKITIMNRLFGT